MKPREVAALSREAVAQAYDSRYAEAGELRETDAFYRWVLDRLEVKSGQRLVDVASGEGHLVRLARERGLECAGVDISPAAAALAGRVTGTRVFSIADGEKLPFSDASLDRVTNLGSLEHFADPLAGVREMRRVLRPEGLAAILLPNSYYLADIVWHVWRTGYTVSHRQVVERFATYGEWKDLLAEGGLKVVRAHKYNFCFPRTRADWAWYRRHPRKWLYLLIAPVVPFNLSYSFLYLCARG